jgi:hypothetical protein
MSRKLGASRLGFIILFWLVCFAIFAARLAAQGETTSAIVGLVTDPSGAATPGATVTIISTETGTKRTTKTDDDGRFNFPAVEAGSLYAQRRSERF